MTQTNAHGSVYGKVVRRGSILFFTTSQDVHNIYYEHLISVPWKKKQTEEKAKSSLLFEGRT